MWTLAHEQGIALPVKDYWDFEKLTTISDPRGVDGLPELDAIYKWTELIQSSPLAVERSVHGTISGAYRRQNITTLEVRFNPMKRNRGGERDLDHIILAAIRGLDRAELEYPKVRAGLIVMMDRTFTPRAERDHRREGDPLVVARRRRHRHRRARGPETGAIPTATSRRSSSTPARRGSASRSTSARRAARTGWPRSARSPRRCDPSASGTASSPPATRRRCNSCANARSCSSSARPRTS